MSFYNSSDHGAQAEKARLRDLFRERRRFIPADLRNTTQWKVINHLRSLQGAFQPSVIGLYHPLAGEIDLRGWAKELWADGNTVALPRVVAHGHPLTYNIWYEGAPLELDALGIPCATGPEIWPAIMVVPCLGYTKNGFRLGYGGGFYDITLKHMALPTTTVGVAYTELEVEHFPAEYHDQPLDYIVTGKEVITTRPTLRGAAAAAIAAGFAQ